MIPAQAVEVAYDKYQHLGLNASDIEGILEAAAPHMLASVMEELAEARNEDDTLFIFTWGQRDWMRREAVNVRTEPRNAR